MLASSDLRSSIFQTRFVLGDPDLSLMSGANIDMPLAPVDTTVVNKAYVDSAISGGGVTLAQGELIAHGPAAHNIAFPAGDHNNVLTSDTTAPTGLLWTDTLNLTTINVSTVPTNTTAVVNRGLLDARAPHLISKGMFVAGAGSSVSSATPAPHSDNLMPVSNSAQPTGLAWNNLGSSELYFPVDTYPFYFGDGVGGGHSVLTSIKIVKFGRMRFATVLPMGNAHLFIAGNLASVNPATNLMTSVVPLADCPSSNLNCYINFRDRAVWVGACMAISPIGVLGIAPTGSADLDIVPKNYIYPFEFRGSGGAYNSGTGDYGWFFWTV
jgi:hypothetical protein